MFDRSMARSDVPRYLSEAAFRPFPDMFVIGEKAWYFAESEVIEELFVNGTSCKQRAIEDNVEILSTVEMDLSRALPNGNSDQCMFHLLTVAALVCLQIVVSTFRCASQVRARSKEKLAEHKATEARVPPASSGLETDGHLQAGPSLEKAPAIYIEDADMDRFEQIVDEINQVKQGLFHGECSGGDVPAWPKGSVRAAIKELRTRIPASAWPHGGKVHDPLDDIAYAQRLIAANLDVEKTVELVNEYRKFREGTHGSFNSPSRLWLENGVVIVPCEDVLGRPLLVVRMRYHRPGHGELFRSGMRSALDTVKLHCLHKRSGKLSKENPLDQYAMIYDLDGATWSNIDWECFRITLEEGAKRYPNMGSQIYILNASPTFMRIWGVAQKALDGRLRRKCSFIRSSEVPDLMRKLVPSDKLCPEYGGTGLPWLGPQEARTLEDQAGELMARVIGDAGVVPPGAKPRRITAPDGTRAPIHSESSRSLEDTEEVPEWPSSSSLPQGSGCMGRSCDRSSAGKRSERFWCW